MKNKTKIIIAFLVLSVLFIIFGFANRNKENAEIINVTEKTPFTNEKISIKDTVNTTELPLQQEKVATLEINEVSYQTSIINGTSVYDFMNKLRTENKINFKEKTYLGLGKFIEEINGIKSDGDKYWIYYVNNKKASIGVSNYKINPGDVVSWKHEKDIY